MSRQRLGQHFLRSSSTLRRIAESLLAVEGETILEIGPGKGALTGELLARGYRVEAVEIDPQLAAFLRTEWPPESSGLSVHEEDVLAADLTQWGPVIVAGNLPYYITSPILRKLFTMGGFLRRAVLLIQREVAERLVAKPGTRDYGFLTVLTQFHAEPELLFRVPPGSFHIPPKVESAVVRLTPRPDAPCSITDAEKEAFVEFLGHCFSQKRKTLRNNLRSHGIPAAMQEHPAMALRAEQLSLVEFTALFREWSRGPG